MIFGDFAQGKELTESGIGEEHVDSTAAGLDGLVKTIEIREFGDVPLNTGDVLSDKLHGLIEFLLTSARDEHVGPFLDEELCRSQSYSRAASGNDDDLILQLAHSAPFTMVIAIEFELRCRRCQWRMPLSFEHLEWTVADAPSPVIAATQPPYSLRLLRLRPSRSPGDWTRYGFVAHRPQQITARREEDFVG